MAQEILVQPQSARWAAAMGSTAIVRPNAFAAHKHSKRCRFYTAMALVHGPNTHPNYAPTAQRFRSYSVARARGLRVAQSAPLAGSRPFGPSRTLRRAARFACSRHSQAVRLLLRPPRPRAATSHGSARCCFRSKRRRRATRPSTHKRAAPLQVCSAPDSGRCGDVLRPCVNWIRRAAHTIHRSATAERTCHCALLVASCRQAVAACCTSRTFRANGAP
eukprot:6077014-Prymnesium_polylepis.2